MSWFFWLHIASKVLAFVPSLYSLVVENQDSRRHYLPFSYTMLLNIFKENSLLYFVISAHSTTYHTINIQSCINHGE